MLSKAQATIEVLDKAEKLPLPYAHVHLANLAGEHIATVLTDISGTAQISADLFSQHADVALKVSYVGFSSVNDTLQNGAVKRYYLKADDVLLNEVVVTAQYAPNSPERSVHSIRIIDEEKIERMAAVNLEDVLSNELNIRISQDNVLGSSISMQGVSGQNVKIMIDGVPVIGRQNGNIDLSQINLNDVERIEIVEGPLSVNYGTNALAGTINIITKKQSEERSALSVSSYNESIGTYNLSGSLTQKVKKARVSISGGRNFFDGWNPGDRNVPDFSRPIADTTRFQSWKPREQYFGRAQVNYRAKDILFGYKFEYFNEMILNRGYPRAPYNEMAFDDHYRTTRMDHAISAGGKLSKSLNMNFVAAYNHYKRRKNTYSKNLVTLEKQLSQTPGDQDTTVFDQYMSRASIAYAKPTSKIHGEIGYDINYETALGQRIEGKTAYMGDYALFASAEVSPWKQMTLRPGLRYAYNTAYKAPLVPSLNLKYAFRKVTLRASYAQGFRAPSLKEVHFYFVDINHNIIGNPALNAEKSSNYAISAKYKHLVKQTIFQAELSGFYNDINNLITLAQVSGAEFSYVNIGTYKTVGSNAGVSLLWQHFKVNLGASYIGRYNDLEAETGERITFSPEWRGNVLYDWQKARASASIFYKYQGALPGFALDENGDVRQTYIDGYHMLDFTVTKKLFASKVGVSAGIKNLLDVQNVYASLASAGAHTAGGGSSAAVSTGRLYFLKLDLMLSRK